MSGIAPLAVPLRRTLATIATAIIMLAVAWPAVWSPDEAQAGEVLWVNDLEYGSAGGGFYLDTGSNQVWTAERGWHLFSSPAGGTPQPLWVNDLDYGSAGGGFYWDPVSGLAWVGELGWHQFDPLAPLRHIVQTIERETKSVLSSSFRSELLLLLSDSYSSQCSKASTFESDVSALVGNGLLLVIETGEFGRFIQSGPGLLDRLVERGVLDTKPAAISYTRYSMVWRNVPGGSALPPVMSFGPGNCDEQNPLTPPQAPTGVTATAESSTSIRVGWKAESDPTSFRIQQLSPVSREYTAAGNSRSYVVTGLTPDTQYCFNVYGVNSQGAGPVASTFACATTFAAQTVPAVPTAVEAGPQGPNTIVVYWRDNSNNETGFLIHNGERSWSVGANSTSFVLSGLSPGTYMCFFVAAFNAQAQSEWSQQACTSTPESEGGVPAVPTNVVATAEGSAIVVTWSDNSNNESGFSISNGDQSWTVGANSTSFVLSNLSPGTYMCFFVAAVNAQRHSGWSDQSCTTTPESGGGVPAMPTNVVATSSGFTTIVVTWSDNSNNESGFSISNGDQSWTVGANSSSFVLSNLNPGTYMCFFVAAFNAQGQSEWSEQSCTSTSVPT